MEVGFWRYRRLETPNFANNQGPVRGNTDNVFNFVYILQKNCMRNIYATRRQLKTVFIRMTETSAMHGDSNTLELALTIKFD